MTGRKNYVLDTSVLMHDPNSFMHFQGNDVFIPFVVLEELDNFKKLEITGHVTLNQVERSVLAKLSEKYL